jgi:MFS family permease
VILACLIVACVLDLATVPLVATVADRIGRRTMLLIGAVYMAAIAFPFFWLLDTGNTAAILLAMVLIVTIGHAVTYSAVAGFLAEMFDARLRYTGVSTAYQVGGLITSGPAPFAAAALFAAFAGSWPIALYIVVACLVTVLALLAAPAPVYRPSDDAKATTTASAAG